jgi:hypothetical protein
MHLTYHFAESPNDRTRVTLAIRKIKANFIQFLFMRLTGSQWVRGELGRVAQMEAHIQEMSPSNLAK